MKSALFFFKICTLFVCSVISGKALNAQVNNIAAQGKTLKQHTANAAAYSEKLQQQPLLFIENRGQVADADGKLRPDILFTAQSGGAKLYFTDNAIHYQFTKTEYVKEGNDSLKRGKRIETFKMDGLEKKVLQSTHRFTVSLQGANPHPSIKKEQQSDYVENYYLAQCPNGITGVKSFQKITFQNVYTDIDWVIYSNEGFMKYDFVVHAGADRSLIKLQVKDADAVSITPSGELLIKTKLGEVKEKAPLSFNAEGKEVETQFIQNNDGTIGFNAEAEEGIELRIDPSVVWATYYGGNGGILHGNSGSSCSVDASDNVYLSGETVGVAGIATVGGFDNTYSNNTDAFLVKFNGSGTRLWATYYGGSELDRGNSCSVDGSGNVYVAGTTRSTSAIAFGGFKNSLVGWEGDAFLVKFNSSGARIWATYYGGGDLDIGSSCMVDGGGNVYLAGSTSSNTGIASGGFENTYDDTFSKDFLVKFNSAGSRLWATYYGGGVIYKGAPVCIADGSNNVYLSGSTNRASNVASGGFQSTFGGELDGYLVKFNSVGTRLWATYYGGSEDDFGYSCVVDGSDNVYLSGKTTSTNNIASAGFQNTFSGGIADAFLVKFSNSGVRIWATYYGGISSDYGSSCAVDGSNNVYLVGTTSSTADIACGGFKNTGGGDLSDAFVVKFNSDGARYWGTYYGGTDGNEYVYGCTIDGSDNLYMVGSTRSTTGIASGGHQNTRSGPGDDAFLVKIEGSVIANPALNLLPAAGILYVDKTKSGNGSSWANAAPELAHALKAAQTNPSITQIWVAKGTYAPMHNPSVSASCPDYNHIDNAFLLVNNVKVYGGFSGNGTETSITQRKIALNQTILSGTRYHIVISAGGVGTAELNGFIIEKGKANGAADITVNGQTVYRSNGGGLYLVGSSPRIENCIIRNNSAADKGGGLYAANSTSNFTSNKFSGNTAEDGGGAYLNNTAVTLVNCLVSGNKATGLGGGIYNNALLQTPVIRNSTIASNLAVSGAGGLYFAGFATGSPPLVYNSIIYGNRSGAAVTNFVTSGATAPELRYSIIENNLGYTNSGNNLTGTSPQFIDPKDASLAPVNSGNYSVNKCSPAINTGNNSYITGYPNDLAGYTRILNTTVDRGAYENNSAVSAAPDVAGVVYVDRTKSGDGSSWENAVPELSEALLAARTNTAITAIWVAQGTYYPLYDIDFTCVPTDSRDKAFVLVNNVKLWGGFAGGETMVSQRNYALNETILSGDIGVEGVRTDNSYHVVVSAGAIGNAAINGFTIQDGQATGTGTLNINSINFSRNSCGGMYIISSSPDVTACAIKNNTANGFAAGIYVSVSNATFTNCIISGNSAIATGGGIYSSNPTAGSTAYARFYHCTVSGNKGSSGGGGYFTTLGTEPAKMYNCILYGNKTNAGVASNDIISSSSTTDDPEVYYSIVGNAASTTAYASMGSNSTANPLFTYQEDAMSAPNLAGNYRLKKCSPAINTGSNTFAAGIARDMDFSSRPAFTTVDMGAYEKRLPVPDANGIVYVDNTNTLNEGDGSSWEKAAVELADALKAAKTNTAIQQVWTAKGTYKPLYNATDDGSLLSCPSVNRDNAFVLVNNVKIYGGFAGGEIDTSSRDFVANETILSGDFNDNDVITGSGATLAFANNTENAYHVVVSAGAIGVAELDGFSIAKGNASAAGSITVNGQTFNRINGGGLICINSSPSVKDCIVTGNSSFYGGGVDIVNSSPLFLNCSFIKNDGSEVGGMRNNNSSPTVINCTFEGNQSTNFGGGMANIALSSPIISGCTFTGNTVPVSNPGGGMYNLNSNPTISDCIFSNNVGWGGGINNNQSSAIITNCTFSNNTSGSYGGGISNINSLTSVTKCSFVGNSSLSGIIGGGGMGNYGSSTTVTNCNFSGNYASSSGGGISNYSVTPTTPIIINCSFSGNKAAINGGGIYSTNAAAPVIKNSILWGNTAASGNAIFPLTGLPDVSNNIIEGGYATGANIFNINPLFVSPQPAAAAPTALGDYHLQPCSPALNMGDNSFIQPGVTKDLDSLDRIKYTSVDMGAYEMQTIDLGNTTWKGVNTNWNDKINWCGGYIPYDTTNVIVPLTSNNPLINAGFDNEVNNISFTNNTSIGIANTSKFTINGTYTNNGSTISNNGDWIMAGDSANQTFPGTLATVSAMKNLEVNNPSGLKFDKSFELTGTLIPTAGNINVDNAIVTLNSDATATARVATVPSGVLFSYTGTGKFEIERYIPPHRAWRLLTAPLGTATNLTISQAWQEGLSNANRLSPLIGTAGFGTTITKSTTYNVSDGYDQGSTNTPSIRYHNGTNWGGFPSSTIGTTPGANDGLINDKQGYMLFIRGDRSIQVAGTGVTATVTTLRPKGQLKTGPQTISCSGWTVIGNPYASPINFHQIVLDNPGLPDVFYVWDANLAGSSNVGGWVSYGSYNSGTQTYTVAPLLSGSTFANNKGDISSGSSFMVNYTGTIAINENHKSTLADNVLLRPVRQLSMNLYVVNADSTESINDGLAIKLDDSPLLANAEKNRNFTENLAIAFDNKLYAIQNRRRPNFNDTIFISTGQMKQRNYVLEIKAAELNMPNRMKAYLEDTYLHQYKPVTLEGSTRFAFTVNADSASLSAARFRLLFKKAARFVHIHAVAKETDIEVKWQMEEVFGIEQYEIERSINGINFTLIQNQSTNRHQQPLIQNQWLDISPATGVYYYRIKAIVENGDIIYSDIAKASMVKNGAGMYVYPNPVTGNKLQLRMNRQAAGQYSASLISTSGQKIFAQQWQHADGFATKIFTLPSEITPGIYQLEIIRVNGKKEVMAVEIQRQ